MGKKDKKTTTAETKTASAQQSKKISKGLIRIIMVVVVLILYGNSINYEFTIDDNIFYAQHSSVQKGIPGIGEIFTHGSLEKYNGMTGVQPYRPVTLTSFAIQKQFFNNDAAKAHLVNVILYVLVVLVLFSVLLKLFPATNPIVSGLVVLLFAAHPIHTEVVCSVKSQDELLSALFGLLALSYAASLVKADRYSAKYGILSMFCFALALLSKEGAFAMILIFPLLFWMLLSQSIKRSIIYSLPYVGIAVTFILVRSAILSGQAQNYQNSVLENVLYSASGFAEASATKMEILFHYLRLLFVPWQLSWDYSYNQVPLVNWSSATAWIGLLLYAGMLGFAIMNIKKKPAIAFGIFFYLIMLVPTSNLFLLVGATLAERFLFFPSIGFVIAVVFCLAQILKINVAVLSGIALNKFLLICGCVAILFMALTISRAGDWKSNVNVFESGVENAPKSSRTNAALGIKYLVLARAEANPQQKTAYFNDAIKFSKRSLDILPTNKDALYNIASCYQEMNNFPEAKKAYHHMLNYYPTYRSALNNLGTMFTQENKFDSAYVYLKRCYDADTGFAKSSQNLAIYYFQSGNFEQSIQFARNAIRLQSNMKISYEILIKIYQNAGNKVEVEKYQNLYREMLAENPEDSNEQMP